MGRYFLLVILFLTFGTFANASQTDKFNPQLTFQKQRQVGLPVYIRIFKQEAILELYVLKGDKYRLIETYPICQFSGGLGPKKRESDLKSPEGFYQINQHNLNPNSSYHLSFNIGYPNAFDRSHGYTGRYLMVHGGCISEGCYAIGDNNIEEVYYFINRAIVNGQENIDVHIYPFKMTDDNMRLYRSSPDYGFWSQLKPGYDYFEKYRLPPFIYTSNGQYFVFHHLPQQPAIN